MTAPKSTSKTLLGSGIAVGILVPVVLLTDGATRADYSLWHHGASQLGTGDRAWLQTGNFVAGGLLMAAFAVGVHRVLRPGRRAGWTAAMLVTAAVGLVLAGIVPTDPALGYPPGQPAGVTAAGAVHQMAGLALFAGLSAPALILAKRLGETNRAWAVYSRVSGYLVIGFAFAAGIAYRLDVKEIWQPAPAGLLEHLSLLTGFCWTIALAVHLLRAGHGDDARL